MVHTVGPIWRGGRNGEPNQLANCYRNSLTLTREQGAGSVAFPAISTGVYGYPIAAAARIAISTVCGHLQSGNSSIETASFVLFDAATLEVYSEALAEF